MVRVGVRDGAGAEVRELDAAAPLLEQQVLVRVRVRVRLRVRLRVRVSPNPNQPLALTLTLTLTTTSTASAVYVIARCPSSYSLLEGAPPAL